MNLTLNPEVERRITEVVNSGRYPTVEAVIEAAITEFTDGRIDGSLDADDIDAIQQAQAEIERGEGLSLAEFDAEMAKVAGKR